MRAQFCIFLLVFAFVFANDDDILHFQSPTSTEDMPPAPRCLSASRADPTAFQTMLSTVFRMYTTHDKTEQQSLLQSYYSPRVQFEDPIMKVEGSENYALQFYSLAKFFSSVQIQWSSYATKVPGALGQGSMDVIVENNQTYTFARESWLSQKTLPEKVEMKVITTVTVRDCDAEDEKVDDGLILRHQDVWPENDAFGWSFYQQHMKQSVGSFTSQVFKWLGW